MKKIYKSTVGGFKIVKDKNAPIIQKVAIGGSSDSAKVALSLYTDDDVDVLESMRVVLLNQRNILVGHSLISKGGISSTTCDIRMIAKIALETLATGVILVHNHPSGATSPSQVDIDITRRIKEALSLLDIRLLDHIILTSASGAYYSFADQGVVIY